MAPRTSLLPMSYEGWFETLIDKKEKKKVKILGLQIMCQSVKLIIQFYQKENLIFEVLISLNYDITLTLSYCHYMYNSD